MEPKKIILSAVLFLGLCLQGLRAQEATPATGGNATGNGGSASYSVGQVVYTSNTATTGSVTQGVQQPFEIFIITSLEEAKDISLKYSVYPNPSVDYLTLNMDGDVKTNCSAALYDINGKLLETKNIEGSETKIGMANLVPALYFLKVTQGDKEMKTFKIIKK